MKKRILWLTETALLLALLIVLQSVTKPAGQLVTGSCVNAVLAVAALFSGCWSGVAIALLSPLAAFLLGIGPQFFPIVSAIALGNAVYVLVLYCLARGKHVWTRFAGMAAAAVAKALTLYLVIVQLLCRVLPLKPPQIETFSAMFSWPQLVTALIGGTVALLIVPALKKALHR